MERLSKVHNWWPTPILVVEHQNVEALNGRLAEIILRKEREIITNGTPTPVAGVEDGLTAYWLRYNLLNWDDPECEVFAGMVMAGASEYIAMAGGAGDPAYEVTGISCWANVLRHGESLDIHHHDPGFVSAHYTVRSGNSAAKSRESGNTVYYRPGFIDRSQGDAAFGGPWDADWRISVPPTEGRMTFFPSYVRHEVKTHLGEVERISIALDVYIKKQQDVPFYFAPPRWFVPTAVATAK